MNTHTHTRIHICTHSRNSLGAKHSNVQAVVMQRLGELHQGHMAHEQEAAGAKIAEAQAKYTNAEDEGKGDDDTAMAS